MRVDVACPKSLPRRLASPALTGTAALAAVAAVARIGEEGDALAGAALLGAGVAGQQAAVAAAVAVPECVGRQQAASGEQRARQACAVPSREGAGA